MLCTKGVPFYLLNISEYLEIGRVGGVMTTQWQPTSCIILSLCEPVWATREMQFKVKSWSRVSKKDLYDVIKVKGAKVEQLSFFIH